MKDIPYYPNRQDGNSCMVACLKSALEYLKGKPYTWKEVDEIIGYQPNKAAWTVTCWTTLAPQGFDIRMIEPFDYVRYEKEGESYLESLMSADELDWQKKHTNLLEIRPLIPRFLKTIDYLKRMPSLDDIDAMLRDDYLVMAQLNSQALNDKSGYIAHMILVHDKKDGHYIAHDPGPAADAGANRRITPEKLKHAMQSSNIEVTGIKLKAKHDGKASS